MRRGEIWWTSLGEQQGSGPGYRRPVLIVQSNEFNESAIRTSICAAMTSNMRLADAPGNVRVTCANSAIVSHMGRMETHAITGRPVSHHCVAAV